MAPLLIHLHIPKNAGTTLGRTLRMKLGFWPPSALWHHSKTLGFYYVRYEDRLPLIEKLSERDRGRVRLFEAHAGFGLHERLPQPSTYLTMLREPIDRAVSTYYYRIKVAGIDPMTSIEDFLLKTDPYRVFWINNAQVRYLAANHGQIIDVPCGRCTRTMLDVALERLDLYFTFVGIVERYDASMILLRRTLGWRTCYYVRSNVNSDRKSKNQINPASLEFLKEHNALDLELYRFAVGRFEQKTAALGPGFERELALYPKRNARYARWMGGVQSLAPRVRQALTKARVIRRS